MQFSATCAPGLEAALADELTSLGLEQVAPERQAVAFEGGLEAGYRACLWSRVASRVLLTLGTAYANSARTLYAETRRIDWSQHLGPQQTLAVDFVGGNEAIRNSRFGALKVKDAIVDRLRDAHGGERPSIDVQSPDVRVHVYLKHQRAKIALDLSGDPLHLRGHHRDGGPAPLRENLAAGLLRYARWHELGPEGCPLVDPMCGSGTFLMEAAEVLRDRAPGLGRQRWGFTGWLGHRAPVWQTLLDEARERDRPTASVQIFGSDIDRAQVRRSHQNMARAGLTEDVALATRSLADFRAPESRAHVPRGLLVTNPPYGERLGAEDEVVQLHALLGDVLRRRCLGWTGWVLAGSPQLAKRFGLKPARKFEVRNGALHARFCEIPIRDAAVARDR
jgi:23S rRNA (guanine2445-N2)-methyltransferase / 23S rRNA (guanine2069-N7)-methyltransferase